MRSLHTLPAPGAATMRPEVALLLCCARTCMDAESAARLNVLLRQELDWPFLIRTALQHGVMPLLYQSLSAVGSDAVPTAALTQLREHFQANTRYNLFLTGELLRVLHLLDTHGISALPFKGPTLAAAVYGNLTLRQYSDLNILVHKQDISHVKALFTAHGYQLPLTRAQEEAIWKHHYPYAFVCEDGHVMVETHWTFIRRYWPVPLDLAHVWVRPTLVALAGTSVRTFPPEELLFILCVHGSKERWTLLKWVCGGACLLHNPSPIKHLMGMERARTAGGVRMLLLGLSLAHALLGATLPQGVVHRIQADPVVQALASQVRAQLCASLHGLPAEMDSHTFYPRVRERVQDRGRYLLFGYLRDCCQPLLSFSHLITPNAQDQALLSLPPPFAFDYYLLRPVRLLVVHGRRLITFMLKHLPGL